MTPKAAAATVGVSKSCAERELKVLKGLGILTKRGKGKQLQYGTNHAHPLLFPLQTFLEETTLPDDRSVVLAFRGIRGISLLVTTGMLVRETRGSVDLLVVTSRPHTTKIAKAAKAVEHMLALPLRYAVLKPKDYVERSEANDRLIRDVFEFSHKVILGKR